MSMIRSIPVTPETCAGQSWGIPQDFRFANGIALVPLVAAELPAAQAEFPIVIKRTASGLSLLAVIAAAGQRSPFVDANHAWRARYTPFLLRFYPFVRNATTADTEGGLAIYEDPDLFSPRPDGHWFYNDDGIRNPVLDQIEDDLGRFVSASADTAAALQALDDAGVLEPFDPLRYVADLKMTDTDLLQIDEERLKSLPAPTFIALRDADAIPVAYCHLLSLQHLGKLLEEPAQTAQAVQQGARAEDKTSFKEKEEIAAFRDAVAELLAARNPYSAVSLQKRFEKKYGNNATVYRVKAHLFSLMGRHETATRMFAMLDEEGQLDAQGQRDQVAALLRSDKIDEAQAQAEKHAPFVAKPVDELTDAERVWAPVHLELAAKQGLHDDDRLALARELARLEPEAATHHANLAALSTDPRETKHHLAEALRLGGDDPDLIYRCVSEIGVEDPAEWLWRACDVRPLTIGSARAYEALQPLLPESLKLLHERIRAIWSGYSKEELKVSFGDYGLPYQAFEPLRLAGSRPTLPRLAAYGLREHLPAGARALDIGCNNGYLLLGLADHVSSGEGFDISKACVEIGSAVADHLQADHIRLHHNTYEAFLETNPEPFDLVIACAVHRWIGAPLEQLDTVLRRVVKPNGMVLIESQGQRSPGRIEPNFHDKIDALMARGFEKVHDGMICDDGINARAFYLLRMT